MEKMLRKQLAALHFGPQSQYSDVPKPLETRFMDWSMPPFNAGYHAYKSHYGIGDVQQKIRKPSQLIKGQDAEIYIVGETYSNDQAWVEGAFCTAESVLNDFFAIEPIIDEKHDPFICPTSS
ncbi:MAG: monoamine oxidase [Arenicella sp.]|jgi:monoamine oxidase